MDFPFGGFGIVVKDTIVEGRRPELTRLAFVEEVRWFFVESYTAKYILCIKGFKLSSVIARI